MEKRSANVIIQAPGGTAAKNASTYKIALPTAWINAMGISASDREVELCFDGSQIILSKRMGIDTFIECARKKGHSLYLFSYYNRETLCSRIAADYTDRNVSVENQVEDYLRTAFGNNRLPCWEDLQHFLEERCIPRSRAGLREYLEAIGVEEYDPIEIIKKTEGRMAEDEQWIRIEVLA